MNTLLQGYVRELIQKEAVITHFQPIVSVRDARTVGVEALSRGAAGGDLTAPQTLFAAAEREGVSRELDKLCSRKALETFAPLHKAHPELVLFINIHAAALEDLFSPDGLVRHAERLDIDPKAIATEILESNVGDAARLRRTVTQLRAEGVLVVMDDVGVGHSNFERLIDIRPDIIKIDKGIVCDLHKDYYRREIFRMLIGLADGLGGWVIAEGVEAEEEALVALELQADMFQGFHFGHPQATFAPGTPHLQRTAAAFRRYTTGVTEGGRRRTEARREVLTALAQQLEGCPEDAFEPLLAEATARHQVLLSAFILDETGVQVTGTAWSAEGVEKQKALIFKPSSKGKSHALQEYYYLLIDAGLDPFETRPHVPLPTGELAVTLSTTFRDDAHTRFVLCAQLSVDELRHTPFD